MMYNIRGGAIRWQIGDFLSDCNSNVCFISHHIRKTENDLFDLENKGQSQVGDNFSHKIHTYT